MSNEKLEMLLGEMELIQQQVIQLMKDLKEIMNAETDAVVPSPAPKAKVSAPKLKLEDVRKLLAQKAREGFSENVKELLHKHGVKKLSELPAELYETIMKEAEELK